MTATSNAATNSAEMQHLYVHVPFCARRCSYCDFSISVRSVTPVASYVESVALELARHDTSTWKLNTVYLGGGTPSRLGAGIADVLDAVRASAAVAPDAEITIEANPDDVTDALVAAWVTAGVNRVSLGAQSFDEGALQWMHRTHSAHQIETAFRSLRDGGIDNISMDLIFALPETLGRDWDADLDRVLLLAPDHLSLYGLTVEPHTPLGRWHARGDVAEAPEESYEIQFMTAHERLGSAGFEHYEVSNFATPGRRSRHNSSYWSGVAYAGIGPSAHSFDKYARSWNVAAHTDWEKRLRAGDSTVAGTELLTIENRQAERVYLGLRTTSGLIATDAEVAVARPWLDAGWAKLVRGAIVLTATGFLRLDALAASLTVAGSR
ncbi:MAG: radical SAM family heme chaperone HemW [Gemmatimonadaceae bacterium]